MQNKTADSFLLLSGTFAYLSLNVVQQYVSIVAAIVAIISGLSAIRYYYIKSKK
jgi:hypothetical protein